MEEGVLTYEPHPKHVKSLREGTGLTEESKGLESPVAKEEQRNEDENDDLMEPQDASFPGRGPRQSGRPVGGEGSLTRDGGPEAVVVGAAQEAGPVPLAVPRFPLAVPVWPRVQCRRRVGFSRTQTGRGAGLRESLRVAECWWWTGVSPRFEQFPDHGSNIWRRSKALRFG